jgi:hypothetical protein
MRKNTLMTILEKKNGQIDYLTAADKIKYEAFINNLPEGYKLEVYMEVQSDDGSLAQLAKIHAMIRELSQHIGETFEDMKLIVKRRAGICIEKEIEGETFLYCKSFGKCSKEELSLVIETIVSIGQAIDYPIG